MKTLVTIEKENYSDISYNMFIEDINYLVNELNVYCEVRNKNYTNIVEQEKRYTSNIDDYKNSIVIEAKGYSQNDWQTYILRYNLNELETPIQKTYLQSLVNQLKRSFTNFNDYYCQKYKYIEIDGKRYVATESFDSIGFTIDNIEFPNEEDVKQEYISMYGIDFDTIKINIK